VSWSVHFLIKMPLTWQDNYHAISISIMPHYSDLGTGQFTNQYFFHEEDFHVTQGTVSSTLDLPMGHTT